MADLTQPSITTTQTLLKSVLLQPAGTALLKVITTNAAFLTFFSLIEDLPSSAIAASAIGGLALHSINAYGTLTTKSFSKSFEPHAKTVISCISCMAQAHITNKTLSAGIVRGLAYDLGGKYISSSALILAPIAEGLYGMTNGLTQSGKNITEKIHDAPKNFVKSGQIGIFFGAVIESFTKPINGVEIFDSLWQTCNSIVGGLVIATQLAKYGNITRLSHTAHDVFQIYKSSILGNNTIEPEITHDIYLTGWSVNTCFKEDVAFLGFIGDEESINTSSVLT